MDVFVNNLLLISALAKRTRKCVFSNLEGSKS